ncbi:MAG: hypothetical protein H6R10_3208 [Rhodocyclaceae bacterium]|nr:hypothetical protein [Rhodocyclaceae bacterium]
MKISRNAGRAAGFRLKRLACNVMGVCLSVGAVGSAYAFSFDTGNSDVKMSWDNTLKYSAGWRVRDIDSRVADNSIGPQANTNDGDLNFKKGAMISNRLDLLSEFDLRYKDAYGFRVSGAAWYDDVYHRSNDNPGALGGALVNYTSVPSNQFPAATRSLHGRKAEFRDAFVYAGFTPGDMNVNVKGGQYSQLYGETLFFGYNGIAAAQTPLDLVRALSVPNSQFKEIALPVKQVSTQVQINPNVSVGAYYQLEWKKNRIPGAGSYFSFADFADDGGENVILGPGAAVHRGDDLKARDSGQGGAQVKFKTGDLEFGLYAAQFHDKMPQFYVRPGVNARGGADVGDYFLVYAEKIKTYGASVSTLVGETNVAAELSVRNNMPMVANGVTVITNATTNNSSNPAYPVGDSLHFNMSAITVLGASPLWQGASFVGELAYNRRTKITKNANQLDPLATRDATAIQFVFQPEYFQVAPGLDLQVPIGVGYGVKGRSSVAGVSALMPSEKGGNISIGVKGDYQKTWQTSLNYTHYYGPSGSVVQYNTAAPQLSFKNFHGDRDFVSLSVQRTF